MTSSQETNVSVEYRIDFGTLNAFFFRWSKTNNFTKRKWVVGAIMTLGFTVLAIWPMLPPPFGDAQNAHIPIWIMALAGAFTGLIISFVAMFILSPFLSYVAQIAGFFVGPISRKNRYVELTSNGIRNSHEGEFHGWDKVHDVANTPTAILIFTTPNCAIMVPKRAFPSPEAANDFAKASTQYWKEARAGQLK